MTNKEQTTTKATTMATAKAMANATTKATTNATTTATAKQTILPCINCMRLRKLECQFLKIIIWFVFYALNGFCGD